MCRSSAAQMIEIVDGSARVVDTETQYSDDLSRLISSASADEPAKPRNEEPEKAAVPEKFMEDEKREHGGVKASVYWEYIKAGKFHWWALIVCVQVLHRLVSVGETWFLKQWGESYDKPSEIVASGLFDSLPSPETNIKPWLLGFFCLAAAQSITFFMAQCVMLIVTYTAGRRMFRGIMDRVSHATFRFYDVTPVGRLMNRMTSDIDTVDGDISVLFAAVGWILIRWITSIVIIASVTPVFLIFAIALAACFALIFRRFLPTSQSLRRLEVCSPSSDATLKIHLIR